MTKNKDSKSFHVGYQKGYARSKEDQIQRLGMKLVTEGMKLNGALGQITGVSTVELIEHCLRDKLCTAPDRAMKLGRIYQLGLTAETIGYCTSGEFFSLIGGDRIGD